MTSAKKVKDASAPPATTTPIKNRMAPMAGVVSTKIIPVYYPRDYQLAQERYEDFEMGTHGYEDYFDKLIDRLDSEISRNGPVLLCPFDVEHFEIWADKEDRPLELKSRQDFLRTCDTDSMYLAEDPTVLVALLRSTIVSATAHKALHEVYEEEDCHDILVSDEYEQACSKNRTATFILENFLTESVDGHAVINYTMGNPMTDEPVVLSGEIDVEGDGTCFWFKSSAEEELFAELVRSAVSCLVGLTVCCHVHKEDGSHSDMLYGWLLGQNGLSGLSEAQLFNISCTTSDGDIIPPTPGLTYCATDPTNFVHAIDGD